MASNPIFLEMQFFMLTNHSALYSVFRGRGAVEFEIKVIRVNVKVVGCTRHFVIITYIQPLRNL